MIHDKPGLSVLIPWYQRDELALTLAANAPFFRAQAVEVLVVNCGGNSGRLRDLIGASEVPGIRQLDISAAGFNKCLALNIGISRSRSDSVLTLDTDIVLLDDALTVALASMDDASFVTVERVFESRPSTSARNPLAVAGSVGANLVETRILELTFPDGKTIHYQASRRDGSGRRRAGPGILLAKKLDLIEVEGYDSNFENWGWEDDDMLVRLQYKRGLRRIQTGAALHLTHGDAQRLPRLGGKSDQFNFWRSCRKYSNGLFLGTYGSDVAGAASKVSEIIPLPAVDAHRAVASRGQSLSGPVQCGTEGLLSGGKTEGLENYLPTIDELLLEAILAKASHQSCNVLHVGIRDSRLASRLSSCCRHITGLAADEREQARAASLGLPNYQPVLWDPYSEGFRTQLPLDTYDIIVDSNFASNACCQQHWMRLMENYSELLGGDGLLLTAQTGRDSLPDGRWAPGEEDLGYLAGQFGLNVSKTAYGAYKLRKQAPL